MDKDDLCIPADLVEDIERLTQANMRRFLPRLALALGREPKEREVDLMHAAIFRHFAEPHQVAPPDGLLN
ncbi:MULTISPECIES: hypothetical protein [unclassified Mesorhizobium]|uniref:hypothetical protein n=1 Tax=unclassified Mesorhizobium TaxID=325217 RepID=UPI000FD6FA48|nr:MULTISPECIES: hypothetical protein [unclassified Mesorhizobium]TGQ09003.1 hypothetical protein EN862_022490 [Mesorhizobium sp. M2E.F.Ca.ET.219.01.1.1]TGT69538.1 hypothetical protein EN809_024770 [Mesorhizobium sp. M2E.F.Ca.ET.166.01.1.1]TGW01870.1 hypothetical protein EN797_016265 [Mesorhizobium sp. M2E.F.Ca.ET.154.01.1.1]